MVRCLQLHKALAILEERLSREAQEDDYEYIMDSEEAAEQIPASDQKDFNKYIAAKKGTASDTRKARKSLHAKVRAQLGIKADGAAAAGICRGRPTPQDLRIPQAVSKKDLRKWFWRMYVKE